MISTSNYDIFLNRCNSIKEMIQYNQGSHMKLTQKLEVKQIQTFTLSYQMKLSVECLQLSSFDLKKYLENKVEGNPLLEINIHPIFYKGEYDFNQISNSISSIQDEIIQQLRFRKISVNHLLLEMLVNLIDDNGYLHQTMQELVQITNCSIDEIERHLQWIKECEPVGVGAYDLKECLLIQMKAFHPNDSRTIQIIEHELENIAMKKYEVIAKHLCCGVDDVMDSLAVIQKLQPRPAINYTSAPINYVKPDVILIEKEGYLEPQIIDYYQIKVNDCLKYSDEKDKKYITNKYQQALSLLESLKKRKETLTNIMMVILQTQQESMLDHRPLKPLRLIDIAQSRHLHETTISRALKDKYVEYQGELFPIKNLLSKQINGQSVDEVKKEIQSMILYEDKQNPYSDSKLQELLQEKGYKVSVRTINKYREELKIANKTLRKAKR